jgi:anti-sigma regulatory factor (Ser/Thr protein kinase)
MNQGPIRFAPDPALLKQVRGDVRQRVLDLGVAAEAGDAVALVIDELVNNAIEHGAGYRRIGIDLSVVIGVEDGRPTIEFVDPEMPDKQVRDLASALREVSGGIPSWTASAAAGCSWWPSTWRNCGSTSPTAAACT